MGSLWPRDQFLELRSGLRTLLPKRSTSISVVTGKQVIEEQDSELAQIVATPLTTINHIDVNQQASTKLINEKSSAIKSCFN